MKRSDIQFKMLHKWVDTEVRDRIELLLFERSDLIEECVEFVIKNSMVHDASLLNLGKSFTDSDRFFSYKLPDIEYLIIRFLCSKCCYAISSKDLDDMAKSYGE